MKFKYQDIQTIFRLNRFIVLSAVVLGVFSSIFSGWMTYKIHRESLTNAFAIDSEGAISKLKWEDKSLHLEIEALAHLEQFHQLFYGLDAASYEQHLEKVLWWGDVSVNELYKQKKNEGYYNRLLQYSLIQTVQHIDSKIQFENGKIPFTTKTVFNVIRGDVSDSYELITTGTLMQVERNFPHNPHGLLVTDFFEKSLRKLDTN